MHIAAALAALLLGIAGDLLLRGTPWGINVPVWTVLFLGTTLVLLKRVRPQPVGAVAWPALAAMLGAVGLAWRDADVLRVFDILLILVSIAFLALPARNVVAWAAGLTRIAAALVLTGVQSVAGAFQLVFIDVPWRSVNSGGGGKKALVAFRGLLLATPLLLIFGALLSSADAAFAKLLADIFLLDLEELFAHLVVILIMAFACAGFLRSLLWSGPLPEIPLPQFLRLGSGETNVAMGLVNILFGMFVAVQFRWLFGGAARVATQPSLTVSEYARRGFFELIVVVALVVPMLLAAEWLIDKEHTRGVRAFRGLALLQVILVFVIVASALERMRLYRDSFGLTEQRVYSTAFIFWLAVVLLWFCVTVLLGRRDRFAIGAIATAIASLVTLHAVNPDDLIVRTNVARDREGKTLLDTRYAMNLSADAVPALAAVFDDIDAPCVAQRMTRNAQETGDWRTWNYSRAQAADAVRRTPAITAAAKECEDGKAAPALPMPPQPAPAPPGTAGSSPAPSRP